VLSIIEAKFKASDNANDLLAEVEGTWVAVYGLGALEGQDFREEAIDGFAEVNGLYHAWPYIREVVASCAARLGLAGVVLPVWRPPDEFPSRGEFHEMSFTPPHLAVLQSGAAHLPTE
jgi:hypothetical protein